MSVDEADSLDKNWYPILTAVARGDILFISNLINHEKIDVNYVSTVYLYDYELSYLNQSMSIPSPEWNVTLSMFLNELTMLQVASGSGNKHIVSLLLNNGADINLATTGTWTALNYAVQDGRYNVAKLLLDRGANVNSRDRDEHTVLFDAVRNCDEDMVKLLLDYNANVHIADEYERNVLFFSDVDLSLEFIKLFHKLGVSIDGADSFGTNLLHIATIRRARNGNIVRYLLQNGVDVNAVNSDGEVPLSHVTKSRKYIAKIIVQHIVDLVDKNIHVCRENFQVISERAYLKNMFKTGLRELRKMKEEKLMDSFNLSYYDFLTKSVEELGSLVRNKRIVDVFTSEKYKELFPFYAHDLRVKFTVLKKKMDFLTSIQNDLLSVWGDHLPYLVILKIAKCLDRHFEPYTFLTR